MKKTENMLFGSLLFLGLLSFLGLYIFQKNRKPEDRIRTYLKKKKANDEIIKIIIAQAKHETDNFTSIVFLRNNNAFGMRPAKVRYTSTIGDVDEDGYANYLSIEDSVEDLLLWWDYHGFIVVNFSCNLYNYVVRLKKMNYFEDDLDNYYNGLMRYL